MKLWSYMAIMLGMVIFLSFLGLNPSGASTALSETGIVIEPTNGTLMEASVGTSAWYNTLFGLTGLLVVLLTGGVVVVGLLTKSFEWKLVVLPFMTGLVVNFIAFGWSAIQMARDTGESWLTMVIATIFLPMIVMFIFSVVEWFGVGGSD